MKVNNCGQCPFSGRNGGWPCCNLVIYFDASPITFNAWNDKDRLVFPNPPPKWCPLRIEPITVSLELS